MYEFVPQTDQSDLVQIDAVDDLIKKESGDLCLEESHYPTGGKRRNRVPG